MDHSEREKNVQLANIYLKIHNKRVLTMEDMAFLAKYDRECFEKTCQNLFYKVPQTKEVLSREKQEKTLEKEVPADPTVSSKVPEQSRSEKRKEESSDLVDTLLKNLSQMEKEEIHVHDMNAEHVREILGNLYMEKLFPHNDNQRFFDMQEVGSGSKFNKKA